MIGRNAGARVRDGKLGSLAVGRHLYGDVNCAFERELESVRKQIENDLFPHVTIDVDRSVKRFAINFELQSGPLGSGPEVRGELGCQYSQVDPFEIRSRP